MFVLFHVLATELKRLTMNSNRLSEAHVVGGPLSRVKSKCPSLIDGFLSDNKDGVKTSTRFLYLTIESEREGESEGGE
ncbi:hypothetical protein J6590_071954 [Homalodisca vitripennis]|nr:hypothetical protein J6590_071954 [Homalodisca vitripennis]